MGTLEIVLLVAGAVIFIASFCIPVKQEKLKEETRNLAVREVKELVSNELENVRGRLTELSEEEMQQQIEKSERSMERISNEKIMAVNEYSDTVLEEIHKNHEEVVFLYDMLKNKKESLSESYGKADQNLQDIFQQVKDSEITVKESLELISRGKKELESREKELENRGKELESTKKELEGRKKELESTKKELEDREKELENRKRKAVSYVAAREKKADVVSEDKEAKGGQPVAEAGEEQPVSVEIPEAKASEAPAFLPFVPEKVEVVPKKKSTRKTPKKQEAEAKEEAVPEKTAGRKTAAKKTSKTTAGEKKTRAVSRGAEEKKAENADVMFMLSDSMEKKAANSNERILELHKAGKSNMAIARELGLGIGEVKLVIDLYEGLR